MSELKSYLKEMQGFVDEALNVHLPAEELEPVTIHKAMRYAVFAGGKRLRPILTLAAAEACGGNIEAVFPAACAVEVMHTYSLVHDDLPSMDDDDLRRGRPTTHKVFGEGMAVLTGDALLNESFAMIAKMPDCGSFTVKDYLVELAHTGGSTKLIGGQGMDLEGEGVPLGMEDLVKIHLGKTAALLTTSLCLGGMGAGASDDQMAALREFGKNLGLAFQVIDDILDVTQSTEVLGKTAGKDEAVDKTTYPSVMGLEASRIEAKRLTGLALEALEVFGGDGDRLREICSYLLEREY